MADRTHSKDVFDVIEKAHFVPLIVLSDAEDAVPMAPALVEGGLPIAEVTFRTSAAAEVMRQMSYHVPECLVGAGTVHNVTKAKEAVDAGARFIITPGMNPAVVDWCLSHDVPVIPGTVTPSDLEVALDFGLDVCKFFPAEAYGGVTTLKALAGPYAGIRFLPTGGINKTNARSYLDLPNVIAVGGSFLTPSALVKAKDWDGIIKTCKETAKIVKEL